MWFFELRLTVNCMSSGPKFSGRGTFLTNGYAV